MPVLTAAAIARLKPAGARREIADGLVHGLYLVAQPSGARSWALRYRIGGRTRKLTLGPVLLERQGEAVPAIGQPMTLAEARKVARQSLQEIAEGDDPATARKADRRAARSGEDRVDTLAAQYVERYCKPRLRQWKEIARQFRVEVIPHWGSRRVQDIGRRDVIDLLDGIVARGAPASANRLLATTSRFYNWLIERDVLRVSPVAGIRKPSPETPRDRVLTDDEVKSVWAATDAAGGFNWIVRLLLLTGQRRSEVSGMAWSELDLDTATWTIPPARSKNRKAHVVPLPHAALDVLAAVPRVAGQDLLFSTTGTAGFSGFSYAKARLDAAVKLARPWVLHDLRRTAASGMARLGVNLPVVERVLNHVGGSFAGVAGVYQRHDFATEKRAALELWAGHVMRIAASDAAGNVVALRGTAGMIAFDDLDLDEMITVDHAGILSRDEFIDILNTFDIGVEHINAFYEALHARSELKFRQWWAGEDRRAHTMVDAALSAIRQHFSSASVFRIRDGEVVFDSSSSLAQPGESLVGFGQFLVLLEAIRSETARRVENSDGGVAEAAAETAGRGNRLKVDRYYLWIALMRFWHRTLGRSRGMTVDPYSDDKTPSGEIIDFIAAVSVHFTNEGERSPSAIRRFVRDNQNKL